MEKLNPYVTHFDQPIWKLLISPVSKLLFIETRNAQNREVLFHSIDIKLNQACFLNLTHPEKWLTGLEACFDNVLLLHGYQSAQSPVHKGITAIDGYTGNILWQNYNYAINHVSTNGPVVYNTQIQPTKLFIVNAQTGEALTAYNPSVNMDLSMDITYPQVTGQLHDAFKPHIEGLIVGNIHYMEYNSFRIVSLHSLIKDVLNQTLLVMQGTNLVYLDLLNDKIQKLQPEAFMMHQNQLIYIKDKAELKVLNL